MWDVLVGAWVHGQEAYIYIFICVCVCVFLSVKVVGNDKLVVTLR